MAGGAWVSTIATDLVRLSGLLAYTVVAVLVFGETALFFGFVLPGETAVILGGVLASRGQVSLPTLMVVVVFAAILGPLVGYEIGRRMGGRLIASRLLRRVAPTAERALLVLQSLGPAAIIVGRFTAVLRALIPALAGTARVPYRTFAIYNAATGVVWGAGYALLGYLAGSAYTVIERRVGTGLAVALAVVVVMVAVIWAVRRHRRGGGLLGQARTAAVDIPAGGPAVAGAGEAVPAEAPGANSLLGDEESSS
jgi:membrane-associated protein